MKKLYLFWLLLVSSSCFGQLQTITGMFVDPLGNPIEGYASVRLSTGSVVKNICAGNVAVNKNPTVFKIVHGVPQSMALVPTDCLTPHVPYYAEAHASNNALLSAANWYIPNATAVDVGDMAETGYGGPITVSIPKGIIANPSSNQTITQPNGSTFTVTGAVSMPGTLAVHNITADSINTGSINMVGQTVNASAITGLADLGAQINAADAQITNAGFSSGIITVELLGTISTPVHLSSNRVLYLKTKVNWGNVMTLSSNDFIIGSDVGGQITNTMAAYDGSSLGSSTMFTAPAGTSNVTIEHLSVTSNNKGSVLSVLGISNLHMRYNTVHNALLFRSDSGGNSSNLEFLGNTLDGANSAEIILTNAKHVRATMNHCSLAAHCIQWWGGDSDPNHGGWANGVASVNLAGLMSLTNNTCDQMGGACIWGSMGFDIEVANNTADGCGDVCFDDEGGVRNTFSGNKVRSCGNFAYAVFFESQDVHFENNTADQPCAGNVTFAIKHASGLAGPQHDGLILSGNHFSSYNGLTLGIYNEGFTRLTVSRNEFLNETFNSTGLSAHYVMEENEFNFTKQPSAAYAAITLPSPANGTDALVKNNKVYAYFGAPANSSCFNAVWGDFNAADTTTFDGNICSGWTNDIVTNNVGTNIGPSASPHANWVFTRNTLRDAVPLVRNLGGGGTQNDFYYIYPDNFGNNGTPLTGIAAANTSFAPVSVNTH